MKKQPEYELQKQICKWLQLQYPTVLFMTDSIAAVKLTMPQASRNKAVQKAGFKCPDLIIFEPNESYYGLFIELKVKSPFKKDGSLRKDEHLVNQQNTMFQLTRKGYKCAFSWSLEMTIEIIEKYLNNVIDNDSKLEIKR